MEPCFTRTAVYRLNMKEKPMRLFTKLRAEEIKTIDYPAAPPVDPTIESDVPAKADAPADAPVESDVVVITTLHGDSHEMLKSDLLVSEAVDAREDKDGKKTGPQPGDWFVQDYDIETDKRINKVYDAATFTRYFKPSLGG